MTPIPYQTDTAGHALSLSDCLSRLPFGQRMQAYDDFDAAIRHRRLAGWAVRNKLPGWRGDQLYDLRQARRYWRHYAAAVRKAKSWRAAA